MKSPYSISNAIERILFPPRNYFFFRDSFNLLCQLLMMTIYYQTKKLINYLVHVGNEPHISYSVVQICVVLHIYVKKEIDNSDLS